MPSLLQSARYLVIEGPIGVGKSSLARRLGVTLGAELLMENAEENPFLERFYADLPGYAFQTQVFFLFQRLRQMQAALQPGMFSTRIVSDFVFAKDSLFARLNLSDEEYRIYAQMYAQAAPQVPEPDLVIWLQAEPANLLERIERRGLRMERNITADYLQRLCDAYGEFFVSYDGAPVFAVGTDELNLVDNEAHYALMIERLHAFTGRRGVLNPSAEASFTSPAPLLG